MDFGNRRDGRDHRYEKYRSRNGPVLSHSSYSAVNSAWIVGLTINRRQTCNDGVVPPAASFGCHSGPFIPLSYFFGVI